MHPKRKLNLTTAALLVYSLAFTLLMLLFLIVALLVTLPPYE